MKKGGGFKNVTRSGGSSSRRSYSSKPSSSSSRNSWGSGHRSSGGGGSRFWESFAGPREPLPREFAEVQDWDQERRDGGFVEGGLGRALGEGLAEGLGHGIGGYEGGSARFWRGVAVCAVLVAVVVLVLAAN
jgi:hypothetical protein